MASEGLTRQFSASPLAQRLLRHWPVVVGLLVATGFTASRLAQEVWSTERGAHGPLVLGTGLWLLARAFAPVEDGRAAPAPLLWVAGAASVALYAFGRAFDFLMLEAGGLYGLFLTTLAAWFPLTQLRRNIVPLAYLAFLVPPPGYLLDRVTMPLSEFVSFAATHILSFAGLPITRNGITMQVGQYQLLVEDACSGLNSIMGLFALALFYAYAVHGAPVRRTLALLASVLPIAIIANLVRVIVLVLLTYFVGNEAAQGFLHDFAGLTLFAVALAMMFLLDRLLGEPEPR